MTKTTPLTSALPDLGVGEDQAFAYLKGCIDLRSAKLGAVDALAHMDPAPADIAARLVGLNASVNQNLLHPDLSPFATEAERLVIDWLAPFFGMAAGHMCAGSTIANLAALWCAREHGATQVVASVDAHISVPKCANILGLKYHAVPTNDAGQIDGEKLSDLKDTALVLTAGTTGRGAVDGLDLGADARWVHVDAAWGGPLRLTRYADRLDGVEHAHSVAISAHKWLFQPKDSALVLFADPAMQDAISFGGAYLAVPNVGVQGSRSAAGVALLGTLLAWGRQGLAQRIEALVQLSEELARRLERDPRCILRQHPQTGVVNWLPADGDVETLLAQLGQTASRTEIDGRVHVRQVAANMNANIAAVWAQIDAALAGQI